MTRAAAVVALVATLAAGCALACLAPWRGGALAFAALAGTAAAGCALVFVARDRLPRGPLGLALLLGATALVRLPLLAAPPSLSDDVHRYVLDGRLWQAGIDPYRVAPAELAAQGTAARVAPDVLARVNHPDLATIYPPGAEAFFALGVLARLDERGLRALFLVCDIAAAWALARLLARRGASPWGAALFALHPLAALESAGSGHVDALAVAFLAWAWERAEARRPTASALLWVLAVAVKPFALLAVPFLVARWGVRRSAVAVALALAACGVLALESAGAGAASGLFTYLAHWQHNDLAYGGLRALGVSPMAARALAIALVAFVGAALVRRRTPPVTGYAWLAACALLAGPVLHPWYALALLVAAPALEAPGPRASAWLLATAVLATYVLPATAGATPGFRSLPLAVRVWELAPVALALAVEAVRAARARGAALNLSEA